MKKLPNFLCDTWWFALTQRLSDSQFEKIARLRVKQGFTAVQLVVGIPPEVGPENPNAASSVGPAWKLNGELNIKYLEYAKHRIELLNSLGLTVIVYGAWGHQIEWIRVDKMKAWWRLITKELDKLNVIYCLTGEADLWVGEENELLPDKSTDDLHIVRLRQFLHPRIAHLGWRALNLFKLPLIKYKQKERQRKWSEVLKYLYTLTTKPIIIHTTSTTSKEVVNNSQLLSAITVQTGHSEGSRHSIWKIPYEMMKKEPTATFINLEPWYEGIMDRFGVNDQLYAYWASMMAGAGAYCYGTHGVWNIGDGKFMAHWGKQTLNEALKLDTPRLLGISHRLFTRKDFKKYKGVKVIEKNGQLIGILRSNKKGQSVSYIPDITKYKKLPNGVIFLPLEGSFIKAKPKTGPVVVIAE